MADQWQVSCPRYQKARDLVIESEVLPSLLLYRLRKLRRLDAVAE